MTNCHQCSADNPDFQPFCQQCGVSLTIWWAIIQGVPGVQKFYVAQETAAALSLDRHSSTPHYHSQPRSTTPATPSFASLFVDPQRRYRFLHDLSPDNFLRNEAQGLSWELQAPVLDLYPDEPSPFSKLQLQSSASTVGTAFPNLRDVPPQVQPYLMLQNRFRPAIPPVHTAWQREGQDVLLLENRSHLPFLQDLCDHATLSPLQILSWLQEMVNLWVELEPWACRRSLLEIANIRVNSQYRLCLQRLYADPLPSSGISDFEIQDLGRVWEQLFQNSSAAASEQVSSLIACVAANMIISTDDLQIMLDELIQEFQDHQPVAFPTTNSAIPTLQPMSPGAFPTELTAFDAHTPSDQMGLLSVPAGVAPEVSVPDLNLINTAVASSPPPGNPGLQPLPVNPLYAAPAFSEDSEDLDAPTVVLPMRLSRLDVVSLTDSGKQRAHNEDFFSTETQLAQTTTPKGRFLQAKGFYILCDGMGGHAGGEVASALAAETLQKFLRSHWQTQLPDQDLIREGVLAANTAIHTVNQQRATSGNGRMGTTLVMALLQDTQVVFAHVGDSRLYRVTRKQGLEQLTRDHEVGQREIDRGVSPEVAYARSDAYQLTQALGPRDSAMISPDIQTMTIREDSLLLLCSDGLTDNDLLETHWQTHLLPLLSSKANLDQGMQQVIDLANQYNGHDNTSVIAIRVKVLPDLMPLAN